MNFNKGIFNNYTKLKKTVFSQYYLNYVRHKSEGTKVVLLNSYSKVGILTAYLLKKTNLFSEICLYEPRNAPTLRGAVADLNNINTPAQVTYQTGKHTLMPALKHAHIVVMMEKYSQLCFKRSTKCKTPLDIAAEILNQAFIGNAEYCAKMAEAYAKICPTALLVVATKPVNSTLPLVCRVAGHTNHNVNALKILGFTTMDVVAANLMWAKNAKTKLESAKVPVVGGSTAYTAIPLFSQMKLPKVKINVEEQKAQTKQPVKAKEEPKKTKEEPKKAKEQPKNAKEKPKTAEKKEDEEMEEQEKEVAALSKKLTIELRKMNEILLLDPNAPLATAAAIAKFVTSLGTALRGREMKEYAYVQSNLIPNVAYLAGPIQVGPGGVQKIMPIPKVSEYEKILLESAPYYLIADIKRGEDYAKNYLKRDECG